MKKIMAFIVVSIVASSVSYAQDAKMKTSSVYDNMNYERMVRPAVPMPAAKYALMETADNVLARPTVVIRGNNTDHVNLHDHTITTGAKEDYIKDPFPKTRQISPVPLTNISIPGTF